MPQGATGNSDALFLMPSHLLDIFSLGCDGLTHTLVLAKQRNFIFY